jgi:hypothetical protein
MLRKPITFTNVDGQQVTEEYFFHLTKAELIKLEVGTEGGLQKHLQDVVKTNNASKILELFEWIMSKAYGKRTDDGRFVKRPEDWAEFVSSEAYSELFMELITNASYAAQFVKAIVPADLGDAVEVDASTDAELGKMLEQLQGGEVVVDLPAPDQTPQEITAVDEEVPVWYRERRDPTTDELKAMGQQEMLLAFKVKQQGFPPIDA